MRNQQIEPPQFLVIGAQKAGTTWLYHQLSKHPDVFIPPVKEVHYFDRDKAYNSPNRLALASVTERINSNSSSAKEWRKHLLNHVINQDRESIFQSQWYLNYLFGNYDNDWYKSLYIGNKSKICGEVTPSYSILNNSDIQNIKKLFPEIKIIFLMRNPIDRDWSHFRYDCHQRKIQPSSVPTKDILNFMNKDGVRARSDYAKILKRWTEIFSQEQILIGYYDQIKDQPQNLLSDICSFLGLDYSNHFREQLVTRKFNQSPDAEIPIEVEFQLLQLHINQLQSLSQALGSYSTQWLLDSKSKLSRSNYPTHLKI
ncbi:sulfotransferase [Pleurocapsa sp. PCC 7319]|uniref:sulfotransferase family protein n=1 Tax=Pleurocapsa sp. PCC 7319 TaxID=118161 RepID=UPI00034BA4FD|nr:sulfotransferase [Pleurocapsa sp. PCC 7319]